MYSSFTIKKELPEGLKEEGSHLTVSLSYLRKNPPVRWMCGLELANIFIEFGLDIDQSNLLYLLSRLRGDSLESPPHRGVGYLKISSDETFVLEYNNNKLTPVGDDHCSAFGSRLVEDLYDLILDPHDPISNLNLQYKEN